MVDVAARVLNLLQAGNVAGAASIARDAIAAGVSHPILFDARGHFLAQQGRYDAALADFSHALTLAPRNPGLYDSAARCLIALDRMPEAIAACDRAIALEPRFAAAYYNKGCAAEMMNDVALAQRCYTEARKRDPSLTGPQARLASLAARRADWAEARLLAADVLLREPANSVATFAMATADLAQGKIDGVIERLRAVLASPELSVSERANGLNLLGDVLDRQDRTVEALAAYTDTNAALIGFYGPRLARDEAGLARVERLKEEFAEIDAARWRGSAAPGEAPNHVFVLGFYRAGTTLLGQILASHPGMVTLEEQPVLIDAAAAFLDAPGGLARLAALSDDGVAQYRALYWERVRTMAPDSAGKIVVDKLPLNSTALPVIARLFPAAKILFAVRDPRDVVFSCFRRLLNVNRDTYEMLTLDRGARFYAGVMAFASACRAGLELDVMDVRNEDLVADFETQVRAICDYLGIGWDPDMARFAEQSQGRAIATPSAAQVARGINGDGIGQWRRYRAALAPVLPVLDRWVATFGYSQD